MINVSGFQQYIVLDFYASNKITKTRPNKNWQEDKEK
jgi:hypothetical protein